MIDESHALLDALKLRHTRAAVAEQLKAAQKNKTSYSAFLLELLRREHAGQRDRTIARRLKCSGLQEYWTLETFPFHIQKCVNKRAIYELAELDFIAQGESVVFIGQSAVGKSGLASGLLMKALYASPITETDPVALSETEPGSEAGLPAALSQRGRFC
jgi:DNA replication protein DnaC